jgi:hypothetical protein
MDSQTYQSLIESYLEQVKQTLANKSSDYESEHLSLINNASALSEIEALQGILFQCSIKIGRIANLLKNNNRKFESIEDSILDLTSYSVILYLLNKKKK